MMSYIALASHAAVGHRGEVGDRIIAGVKRRIASDTAPTDVRAFVSDEALEVLGASSGGPGASFDAAIAFSVADAASARTFLDGLECDSCHAYRVETRIIKASEQTWKMGERTPGLVMVSPVYRADAMSAAEFDTHWRVRHAPLALRHHVGMWDYRQNVVRDVLMDDSPPYDGIALLGFPSVGAFTDGLFDSPDGMRVIMQDTRRFLALDRCESALLIEYRLTA